MNTIIIICSIIGAVAAILGGVWFMFERATKSGIKEYRLSQAENNIAVLPCQKHSDTINIHKKALDEHTELLKSNNEMLYSISKWIMKLDTSMIEELRINNFSRKASPRKLNDMGEKLFNIINGDEFLKTNKDALFHFIAERKPLVALDVEQYAAAACASLVQTPAFNKLKDFVYNEPSWTMPNGNKYDITVSDICFVLGLVLRDLYLQEKPI